jgi:2-polyprenyl-3-methyl-5-hydroxy-6-metoxy-1,4-benzoquinol methylase
MTTATSMEQVSCLLCGQAEARLVHRGNDYSFHLPGTFQMVQCERCGLIYQSPRPPIESIGAFYPDQYGAYSGASSGLRARRGLIGKVIRRGMHKRCGLLDRYVEQSPGQPRRLLDVGCASGIFLEAMQEYPGWQVEGVEPNAAAARATSARLNIPVFEGFFEDARYPDASFDAITLWDVLEHLHDPVASLRELHRILRPNGVLFMRVPNGASYVRTLSGRYWVGYELPRHMTLFTPRTLGRMLYATGFHMPITDYTAGSYLCAIHSLRFALDDGKVAPERAARIHRRLYHPIGRALAWLPFKLGDALAGGSVFEALVRRT